MKKSRSILLLSGFVPLVAAPIVIVTSCSNSETTPTDTTTATKPTESKYTIVFNGNKSFVFKPPTTQNTTPEQAIRWLKNEVIEMKSEIFNATLGTLPADETFWQNNITVENVIPAMGVTAKFTVKLTNASNVDGATEQQKTISAEIAIILDTSSWPK